MRAPPIPPALRMTAIVGAVIVVVVLATYSGDRVLSVDPKGDIDGLVSQARAAVWGKAFWKHQLELAHDALRRERELPALLAKAEAAQRMASNEVRTTMEDLYRRGVIPRPSAAQQQAADLRRQADAIEAADNRERSEAHHAQRLLELQQTIAILEARAR